MIFQKIFYFILLFIYLIASSPLYLINKKYGNLIKKYSYDYCSIMYQLGFNSAIYYNGKLETTNKIDIVTMNHVSSLDFCIFISLLKQLTNKKVYVIQKKELLYLPGLGLNQYFSGDIIINRNFEKDINIINNKISKLNNCIIVIYPEGARYSIKNKKKSDKFCDENNLEKFNNLLYPKMKGLYTISKILHEQNKLGNIIDISNLIQNFHNKDSYMKNIIIKEMGYTFCVIKTYKGEYIENYKKYKEWFLQIWRNKNEILENIDKYKFKSIGINNLMSGYIFILLVLIIFLYLCIVTKGIYFIVLLIYIYYMVYKIINKINKSL
jgi:hypothetical protein